MATTRSFIAIDLPSSVCQRAHELIGLLKAAGVGVKWVDRDTLHITLKFLGDISDQDIAWVCQRVKQVCAGCAAFDLHCQGAGAFPDVSLPRTVWLGVTDGAESLRKLQAELDEQLVEGRFPRETRQFHPHLTLGRVRRGGGDLSKLGRLVQNHSQFDAGPCPVGEVVVYASDLERRGPIYTVLSRSPLLGS